MYFWMWFYYLMFLLGRNQKKWLWFRYQFYSQFNIFLPVYFILFFYSQYFWLRLCGATVGVIFSFIYYFCWWKVFKVRIWALPGQLASNLQKTLRLNGWFSFHITRGRKVIIVPQIIFHKENYIENLKRNIE